MNRRTSRLLTNSAIAVAAYIILCGLFAL